MEKLFGNFSETLISVTQKNVFGTNFAIISGRSVVLSLRAVNVVSHCNFYRGMPCGDALFLGFTDMLPLKA